MLNESPVEPNVIIPAKLETRIAGRNKPEIRFSHDLLHRVFLLNKRSHLVSNLGGGYGLAVVTEWTSNNTKVNGSHVRPDGRKRLSDFGGDWLRNPFL